VVQGLPVCEALDSIPSNEKKKSDRGHRPALQFGRHIRIRTLNSNLFLLFLLFAYVFPLVNILLSAFLNFQTVLSDLKGFFHF
jgi:hypothetical protein